MTNESICLDKRFSTTRLLFREQANEREIKKDTGVTAYSPNCGTQPRGGLRAKGLTKKDVPNMPLVTIITVVFNGERRLRDTITSVLNQTYDNLEYIIIDGDSKDGTLEVIRTAGEAIDYWVSEPDRGIYDAMNKGLSAANGGWINFMNAGDAFYSKESIANTVREFSGAMVYYSDAVFYSERGGHCYYREAHCDATTYQFVHQSCIYRKQLHAIHGQYVVAKGITASDYLFFKSVPHEYWQKTNSIISKYHVGDNISSGRRHDEQVYGIDLLFGSRSVSKTFAAYWLQKIKKSARDMEKSIFGRHLYMTRVEKYSKVRREEFWRDV